MTFRVADVQEYQGTHIMVALDVTDEEGNATKVAHLIPKDAAEWRIAEYGLDPEDGDTVLDVLLFEGQAQADVPEDYRLHRAATVREAREALLGAVQAHKATNEAGRPALRGAAKAADPEPNARARFWALCKVDPAVVEAKRNHVAAVRAELAARPLPLAADRVAPFLDKEMLHGNDDDAPRAS